MPHAIAPIPSKESSSRPFLIFDTHPIQYRSPVFKELYQRMPELKVIYFSQKFDGKQWWFREVGKIPEQNWGIDLQNGFPNEILKRKTRGPLGFAFDAADFLRAEKPSAILIFGYYLPEHWFLWWLGRYFQIPVLFIGETSLSAGGRQFFPRALLQTLFFRGISQFVSIGNQSRAFYRSFSIEEERITRGKYCVDTDFFDLKKEERLKKRSEIREQWGIPKDAFVVLFVGRLFERKRPLDVLKIHQKLSQNSNLYTVIVGNGPLELALKEQAKQNSRFIMAGFKNQNEMKVYYAASDFFLVTSEFETWGLVVNEAFAAGLPALVTHTCGCAHDLVISGETGFVFPTGGIDLASRIIEKLIENPKEARALGERARKRVTSFYRVDQFAEAIAMATTTAIGRRTEGSTDFYP
jgi:glycosyltransferase involved in cell wall biosynthesis